MDKAADAFGNKFSMSRLQCSIRLQRIKTQEYISDYLKDYIERGGKVGQNVFKYKL